MLKKEEKLADMKMKIIKKDYKSYSEIFKEISKRISSGLRKRKIKRSDIYLTLDKFENSKKDINLKYSLFANLEDNNLQES